MHRRSRTADRRRAQTIRHLEAPEALESKSMISESLGILALVLGVPAALAAVRAQAATSSPGEATAAEWRRLRQRHEAAMAATMPSRQARPHAEPVGKVAYAPNVAATPRKMTPTGNGLLASLRHAAPADAAASFRLSRSAAPIARATGGGSSHGGSATPAHGEITPLRLPPPAGSTTQADAAAGALSASLAPAAAPRTAAPAAPRTAASFAIAAPALTTIAPSGGAIAPTLGLFTVSGGNPLVAMGAFTYFPLYTLDFNNGVTLFPGNVQYATLGNAVDLRAQVRDTTVSSYSWNTTNLTHAQIGSISGQTTSRLQFNWSTNVLTAATDSVTLTVTNSSGQQQVQTYSFAVPAGNTGQSGGGAMTWPQGLEPGMVLPGAAAFASHDAVVKANSGALDTAIALPSYSPNVAPVVLTYDSLAADPRPIVIGHHELDRALSIPTQVSGQLTFNGTAGTTYYYDTHQFIPGDVQQIGLQADATALATGRYGYSLAIGDVRGTTTTTTVTGTATVVNEAGSAFGSGWTLAGLDRIVAASGGVVLDVGAGDALWFTGTFMSGGGTYTSPAGDFSTLVQNSGGTYTRTLKDGTQQTFDASGYETAAIDRNGLHTSYGYDSGHKLTTITDPYAKVTTFGYDSGGKLQTVTDPAARVATFTHTGSNLTGVTLPDSAAWAYGYDAAGRMTGLTDPRSQVVTIAYDSAQRVGTITRPDATSETFAAYQERGWTNTGTSGSPAAATLLAEARATHSDPRGDVTDLRVDRRGMGRTNQATDAVGNVSTRDRDANGLATVTIDRLNRITQYAYDSKGNVTKLTYPSLVTDQYTYNGFAEPTSHTDPNGHTTTLTYDSHGNNTVVQDAMTNLTTMTYTANGRLATSQDANLQTTSFAYDSQDRPTTVTYPGGATSLTAYDTAGRATTVTDERSNVTKYAYDPMNRVTQVTNALLNVTTTVYDASGNTTSVQAPLARTTTTAYDSMNRVTTITAPLSRVTAYGYDAAGNTATVTDPMGRVTTLAYDALDRNTVVTDPLAHPSTTTYDAEGQVTAVSDPLGALSSFTYDSRGFQVTATDPLGRVSTFIYSATGKLLKQTDPAYSGGYLLQNTYDADDRLTATTDALSHTTTTVYDAVGNTTGTIDANNHRTTYTYDGRNRLIAVTDPLAHTTSYGYDSGGNRITVTDPLGNVTTTAYDALNRATTVTDARSGQTVTAYDAAGRLASLTDPVGNRTTYAYDAADRVTTVTDPLAHTTTYLYDSGGELVDRTDRDGRRVTFAYDSGGRRTAERWLTSSGGTIRTVSYTYDNAGQLTGVTDPDSTLAFSYDSGGRQLTADNNGTTGQPRVLLTSGYDQDGQRTSLTDNLTTAGVTTYAYDAAHRLTTITRAFGGVAGPQVVYGYDPANRLTSLTRQIGSGSSGGYVQVATSFTYDNADRLTTLTHQSVAVPSGGGSGGTTTPLATYAYGYDNANRLTSETNAEGAVTYGYDATNQLTGTSGARSESYTYDSGGNRTMAGYTTGTANELTAAGGYTFTYDGEGNLLSKTLVATGDKTDFTWDDRNRLTGVIRHNSGGGVTMQATYTYDALNRRIGTNVDADGAGVGPAVQTWTVYDGQNTYADFGGLGTLQQRYLYGPAVDALLARTDVTGTTAWYLTDKLGSVRDIASSLGVVIDHVAYDSYGNVTSETAPTVGDRYKFTGREYDAVTGQYYFRGRYYDAPTGRFIQQDPSGFAAGDADLYRYVGNAPTDATDPSGLIGEPSPSLPQIPTKSTPGDGSQGTMHVDSQMPSTDPGVIPAEHQIPQGPAPNPPHHGGGIRLDPSGGGRIIIAPGGRETPPGEEFSPVQDPPAPVVNNPTTFGPDRGTVGKDGIRRWKNGAVQYPNGTIEGPLSGTIWPDGTIRGPGGGTWWPTRGIVLDPGSTEPRYITPQLPPNPFTTPGIKLPPGARRPYPGPYGPSVLP